ncbi:461_t:CDS:1, partial [Entrophospora sp. SA101]
LKRKTLDQSREWGSNRAHHSFLKDIEASEKMLEINHDLRLCLCILKSLEIKADNQGPNFR